MLAAMLALAWTAIVALVWARAHTHRPQPWPVRAISERLWVLRPVTWADRENLDDLAKPPPRELADATFVYLVDERDAVVSALEDATERARKHGMNVRVQRTHATGRNRKAGQLAHVDVGTQDTPIVIAVDADVVLSSVPVAVLLAPFADANVGAVWAPFTLDGPPTTLADRIARAVLHGSLHAVPLLARLDDAGMVSKVLAYRPDALAQAGGWAGVESCIGDDMALGGKLRTAKWRVVCTHVNARTHRSHGRMREVAQRFGRWCAIMADQRPGYFLTYPGLIAFTPYLLGLWIAASRTSGHALMCGWGAVATCTVRILFAYSARQACGERTRLSQACADSAIADIFINAVALHALLRRDVVWAGRRLPRHDANAMARKKDQRASRPGDDARDVPPPPAAGSASGPTI